MDISIIIVNYNTKELTKNCIDSVFAQTSGITFEVILVDNASTDGSIELFEKDERIRFVESGKNLGFGKANNLGYQYAEGKYLFLLNSDTLLLNNAVKEFYLEMEQRHEPIACMGCLLVDADYQRIHSYGNFLTLWNELVRKPLFYLHKFLSVKEGFDDKPLRQIDDHCIEVEYVTGADIFMKKSVADRLGLFDPDFFMYYEESEMQYRYRKNGYINVIVDTPQVQHLIGGSDQSDRSLWKRNDLPSMILCYRKLYGSKRTSFFKWVMVAAYIPLAIVDFRFPLRERWDFLAKLSKL